MVSAASLRARCMKNSSCMCDALVGIVLRISGIRSCIRYAMPGRNWIQRAYISLAGGVQRFARGLPKVYPVTTRTSVELSLDVVRSVVSS